MNYDFLPLYEDKISRQDSNIVSILAVGDVMFSRKVAEIIKQKHVDYLFSGVDDILKRSDITIGNLETPISNKGTPNPTSISNFRAHPKVITALKRFTILSLANNHIYDFGPEAAGQTIQLLNQQGVMTMGVGKNFQEARKPVVVHKKGIIIGFLNYTTMKNVTNQSNKYVAAPLEPLSSVEKDIINLKSYVNFVVVSLHFGYEGIMYPSPEARGQAKALINCGADLIIGHHPHVLQGIEKYKSGFILYSLGDFIFDGNDFLRKETGIFKINLNKSGVASIELLPAIIDKTYRPVLANSNKALKIYTRIKRLSSLLKTNDSDKLFLKQAKKSFIKNQMKSLKILFKKNGIRAIIMKLKHLRLLHFKILWGK